MRLSCFALALSGLALAATADAHHSGAMFDNKKDLTLNGTVKSWLWQNPHTWVQIMAPDSKGQVSEQGFELGSPNTLVRNGFKSSSFQPGDKVELIYHPRIDGTLGGEVGWIRGPHSNGWLKWVTSAPMPAN